MSEVKDHKGADLEAPQIHNAMSPDKKHFETSSDPLSENDNITEEQTQLSPEDDRRILRRIDLCLLPVLGISYMFQYLDKSAMGYTAILGLREDLKLVGQSYSWASSLFYFGYLAGSAAAAFLIVRFPIGRFMSVTITIWAIILMLMTLCKNSRGLWSARFFLGFVESALAPGMALIIGMWYKRSEQPLRQAAWFMGNVLGGLFGGVLSYAMGHINSIAPWKGLFLLFGGITALWSIAGFFFIPDSPQTARFLSESDRCKALERIQEELGGVKDNKWKWKQFREAMVDPKTWFLVLFQFSQTIPNCVGTFASIIVEGFGFSTFDTLLVQMIGTGFQIVFVAMSSIGSSYMKNTRTLWMALNSIFALAGAIMIREINPEHVWARFMGYCLIIAFSANFPLTFAMVTANTSGFTKRTTTTSLIFIAYCTGNIIGPQLMFEREAPSYPSGFAAIVVCLGASILIILSMRFYLMWENRRRDKKDGAALMNIERDGVAISTSTMALNLLDMTDREIRQFRYVY